MAVVDTKVKISLVDDISKNLRAVQSNVDGLNQSFGSLARAGSVLAASMLSMERVASGFTSIINSGISFNKTIETASVGMSGVLISMTKLADRELKWNEAMLVSRNIIKDLNKQALLTAATPQELTQTFSGLMGIGIGRGLTIEQIKSFTVMGVNAVKSMGLEGRQLIQELRDLLQGSISPQKSTLATALGITTADIKAAQNSAEGLFKFLEKRMNGFRISANYFPNTFQGSMAVLSGAFQMLIAEGMEEPMKRITELAKEMFRGLLNENQSGFSKEYTEPIKEAGNYLAKIVDSVNSLGRVGLNVLKSVGAYAVPIFTSLVDNIDLAAIGFINWKATQQFNKTIAAETLDIYTQINRSLSEGRATLAASVSLEKARADIAKISAGTNLYGGMLMAKGKMANADADQAKMQQALDKAKIRLNELMNPERLHGKSDWDVNQFTLKLDRFNDRLQTLGLSELEAYKTSIKLAEAFPKLGGSVQVASKEMALYIQSLMGVKASNEQLAAFSGRITEFGTRLEKMGVSAANSIAIQKQLINIFNQSGEAAAVSMMKVMEAEAKATELQNKWARFTAGAYNTLNKLSSGMMGLGMTLSIVGEKMDNDLISKFGGWANQIAMLAYSFQMLWASMNPATAAIAVGGAAIFGAVKYAKGEGNAQSAGWGSNFWGWYSKQFGTAEEYSSAQLEEWAKSRAVRNKGKTNSSENANSIADSLIAKFTKADEASQKAAKEAAKTVKLLDDADKVSASISAKLADRTMTNQERAFANLNKEVATFQAKIDTLKAAGQDVEMLQAQLDNYSSLAAAKLEEKFNTLKIRWDDVLIHIKNSQTNFTDIISAGYDSLANDFVNFGQNIITEGGNFFERFDDLLRNFANNVCNTLMKIYMQGILTRSVLGFIGGGLNTSWIAGSTESASGWLSIGKYIVGHANGGVASGLSLVGENGPELIDFRRPARVYTNEQTREMLGGGTSNIKIELINESGQKLQARQGEPKVDLKGMIIPVILEAYAQDYMGTRRILQGAR